MAHLSKTLYNQLKYILLLELRSSSKAKIIPSGKQKINPKNETINVNDNPPHALVSTHSRPKEPPEIKKLIITKCNYWIKNCVIKSYIIL